MINEIIAVILVSSLQKSHVFLLLQNISIFKHFKCSGPHEANIRLWYYTWTQTFPFNVRVAHISCYYLFKKSKFWSVCYLRISSR